MSDCPRANHGADHVRKLQRALSRASKQDKERRFYSLYDKVWRAGVLWEAWRQVKAHKGAPGVAGQAIEAIIITHQEEEMSAQLQEARRERRAQCAPGRLVEMPKPTGGTRPRGIAPVKDRVVQTALKLVMAPIDEADFHDCSYGYRPKRLARFGLSIHPTKTALVSCRKPDGHTPSDMGNGTCDFLGLTHYWTKARQGFWVSKRRTARKRLRRTKQALWRWCRTKRPAPLQDQYHRLSLKLRGHLQYYGMRGNFRLLEVVSHYAAKAWRYWLSRRSSQSAIGWEKFQQLLETYALPIPRIVHNI